MFTVECVKSNDFWNLTVGDIYKVYYDDDNSEWIIKDDFGTFLHLDFIDEKKFKLLSDDDVCFLVLEL